MKLLAALICYPLLLQGLPFAPATCSLSPIGCCKITASASLEKRMEKPGNGLTTGRKAIQAGPMSAIFRW